MEDNNNFKKLEDGRNCEMVADVMKVLSHSGRLRLLCHLASGSKKVGELQEYCNLSQPHVSQFLSKMQLQGIVSSHKEGNFVVYSLEDKKIMELIKFLQKNYCDS